MSMSKFHCSHLLLFYKGQNGRNKGLRIGMNEFDHPSVLSQCKQQWERLEQLRPGQGSPFRPEKFRSFPLLLVSSNKIL